MCLRVVCFNMVNNQLAGKWHADFSHLPHGVNNPLVGHLQAMTYIQQALKIPENLAVGSGEAV